MENYFLKNIEEIQKLLNCWIHKLSHLALVLPNLAKQELKILKNMFFIFQYVFSFFCGQTNQTKYHVIMLNYLKGLGAWGLLTKNSFGIHSNMSVNIEKNEKIFETDFQFINSVFTGGYILSPRKNCHCPNRGQPKYYAE